MPTFFSTVYDNFLSKIKDVEFLNQLVTNTSDIEEVMKGYLQNSIPRFRRCKQNLNDIDLTLKQFNVDLNFDEIDILGDLVLIQYLTPQINTINLIKQSVSNSDFRLTSQAAHLKILMDLRSDAERRVERKIVEYTYNFNVIKKLK